MQVSVAAIWRDGSDAGGAVYTFEVDDSYSVQGAVDHIRETAKTIGRDLLSETGDQMRDQVMEYPLNWGDFMEFVDNDDLSPYGITIKGINGIVVVDHDEVLLEAGDLPTFNDESVA